MQDECILDLYHARDPAAIVHTAEKYGGYLAAIARNILCSREDAEECVSDTYFRAWNAIPPQRPRILSAYLGRITRNLSLNRFNRDRAQKRGGNQVALSLDELSDCVSGSDDVQQALEYRALVGALNDWLAALSPLRRCIFLRRYWYFDSIPAIAVRVGKTENHVSVLLSRMRSELRAYLTERGFEL